ncbi:ABC transporter permease subunit [Candidatus Margulisiibacteriota bacterium]
MKKNTVSIILLWALGAIIFLFLILPIIRIIASSDIGIFFQAAQDKKVLTSIFITLECAAYATIFSAIFGVALAYIIARYDFWGKSFMESAINIPVIIPHTAAGIALLSIFSKEFFIGRWLGLFNISVVDSKLGIVIGMFFVSAPFLINASINAFRAIDEKLEKTARTLGANFGQTFFKISLPLAKNGILKGMLMMWARGISEFGAVVVLAYHPMVAPVLIFENFEAYGLKYSKPLAALLIIICLVIFFILTAIGRKNAES